MIRYASDMPSANSADDAKTKAIVYLRSLRLSPGVTNAHTW